MGLSAMSESCGVPYDTLAWTAEWYFSAETLEAANAAIVNYHHRLPMTQANMVPNGALRHSGDDLRTGWLEWTSRPLWFRWSV